MSQPSSTPTTIVPLRSPGIGKTRLASHLTRGQRATLAAAMLADVVAALRDAGLDDVLVAASGPGAVVAARQLELPAVRDPADDPGLDAALAAAAARVDAGADLLVVAADLPCLGPADVRALLASPAQVVLAPTADGGTGGLLRRGPARIATAYGPGSAQRHRRTARSAGASFELLALPGFHRDVDTWQDLTALPPDDIGARTATQLRGLAGAGRGGG